MTEEKKIRTPHGFVDAPWATLKAGDEVYINGLRRDEPHAYGPYTVIAVNGPDAGTMGPTGYRVLMNKKGDMFLQYQDVLVRKPNADENFCFIALVLGNWGRGNTITEAAAKCKLAGGQRGDRALVYLVLGDPSAYVDDRGSLWRGRKSVSVIVMKSTLGRMLPVKGISE